MAARSHTIRIGADEHTITAEDVVAVANRESPRRLNAYYVEILGRRFPPKQLLRGAIGPSTTFDTGVAVRALHSLGFEVVKIEG